MTFRIEVCATSEELADEVIRQVGQAADDAGVDGLTEVQHHTHDPQGPVLALVVASDGPPTDRMVRCTARALAAEQIVIPLVDDARQWNDRVPVRLQGLNAVNLSGRSAGTQILEAAGVLTPLRGVFLSHRRTDGAAMAMQLAGELRRVGIGTFVDVLDIVPVKPVQDRILGALDDLACLVLLESPDALGSDWVKKEVVYAQEHHLGALSLCWADEDPPGGPPVRFAQFTSGNRIDVRRHLLPDGTLTPEGVRLAISAILREFTHALYFRRLSLERELLAAFPRIKRIKPWLFALGGDKHTRLVGLAPYRPGALDLHAVAVARQAGTNRDAYLLHHAINAATVEADMLAWIGGKGPEAALDLDKLARLGQDLEEETRG